MCSERSSLGLRLRTTDAERHDQGRSPRRAFSSSVPTNPGRSTTRRSLPGFRRSGSRSRPGVMKLKSSFRDKLPERVRLGRDGRLGDPEGIRRSGACAVQVLPQLRRVLLRHPVERSRKAELARIRRPVKRDKPPLAHGGPAPPGCGGLSRRRASCSPSRTTVRMRRCRPGTSTTSSRSVCFDLPYTEPRWTPRAPAACRTTY